MTEASGFDFARQRRQEAAADAMGSVLAELPGDFTPGFADDLQRLIAGTITPSELVARAVERHRRTAGD